LGIHFPLMLFARNPLAPGPQAYYPPGKRVAKVKGGKDIDFFRIVQPQMERQENWNDGMLEYF